MTTSCNILQLQGSLTNEEPQNIQNQLLWGSLVHSQ